MKSVPFKVMPSEPLRVVVEAADGKLYNLDLRLVVVQIVDTEAAGHNPALPGLTFQCQVLPALYPADGAPAPLAEGTIVVPSKLN